MLQGDDLTPHTPLSGITLGVLATVAWVLFAGFFVQQRHAVPPIAEYKGAIANVAACQAGSIRLTNQCLDSKYDGLLADWRSETAIAVVTPPLLAWLGALLFGLWREIGGLTRRSQRA